MLASVYCAHVNTHKSYHIEGSQYKRVLNLPQVAASTLPHLWVVVDLLCTRTGRLKAGQHLQQVKEGGEVGLLQEQQHGDVLLLGRRQTGGRQLNALTLPFPPRSSQRHKHHLVKTTYEVSQFVLGFFFWCM